MASNAHHSFVDYTRVKVKAGDGGDGAISFRREKFVPRGGPNGGDGGNGGSVWFEADSAMATLLDLKLNPQIKAEDGNNGEGWQRTGRTGEELVIAVPLGTVVSDEDGTFLADLTHAGQRWLAAQGGKGGLGNQNFATPTHQTPRRAYPGTPGEERALVLELKLIAQAGLIGLPNAGKSTLLGALTAATPKIAPYPFTTLHPNLGVMEADLGRRVTLADIPGLIEGAVQGVGLGARFLRHIERTGLLIHLVAPPEGCDPAGDPEELAEKTAYGYDLVRREIESYSALLASKPELVALTKTDLMSAETRERLLDELRGKGLDPVAISAENGDGLEHLRRRMTALLDEMGLIEADSPMPETNPETGDGPADPTSLRAD